jgi:hypothetical protein
MTRKDEIKKDTADSRKRVEKAKVQPSLTDYPLEVAQAAAQTRKTPVRWWYNDDKTELIVLWHDWSKDHIKLPIIG